MTTEAKQLSFFDIPGFEYPQDGDVQQEMFSKEELENLRTKKKTKGMTDIMLERNGLKVENEKGNLDKRLSSRSDNGRNRPNG